MILRIALSESPIASLKFEHLSNQRTETTLWLVRDTYPNAAVWLVRATYHSLYANIDVIFFGNKEKKNSKRLDAVA